MRMYDIIMKKREGKELEVNEIAFFVKGYTSGEVPDYQAAALLMAIMFNGMTKTETAALTLQMAKSGDMLDLSSIDGIKVDKHSTGGVGDKVSLVVGPIAAANGVPVAKMSGRGLGHTGGTVDKMESIPGFNTELATKDFIAQVQKNGLAIIGQTGNIAPADKKLYALRDVTATVDSIPLIAASIMSKKLASGADAFVLDVKVGSGAFAKTPQWATELADAMVEIATENGKKAVALLTNMDRPLGRTAGNWLEIAEVIETLQGKGPEDLTFICGQVAANMLFLADKGTLEQCQKMVDTVIQNGRAFEKFKEMVAAQGGDTHFIDNPEKYPKAAFIKDYTAKASGYIESMNTENAGIATVILGAGRAKKEDIIDPKAGIVFHKKTGDKVDEGDKIATLYTQKEEMANEAALLLDSSITIGNKKPESIKLIY
ncbi:MAG: pyrimidine-nucleoside phosphorylase [Defluviitaleaceae bacterium]|nr:pyrimidine-nucleoside phosphorylase [Defluviitaleaceae bacterium]